MRKLVSLILGAGLFIACTACGSQTKDLSSNTSVVADSTESTESIAQSDDVLPQESSSDVTSSKSENSSKDSPAAVSDRTSSSTSSQKTSSDGSNGKIAKSQYFLGVSPSVCVGIPQKEWDDYKELGVKSLRIHIQYPYCNVQNGVYDFSKYDITIKKAKQLDIECVILLTYESYPSNASQVDVGWGKVWNYGDDALKIVPVIKQAITHFKTLGVKKYEIWNEQNGMWTVPEETYAKLLSEVYEKCKYTEKWDPEAIIGFGGMDAVNMLFDNTGTSGPAKQYLTKFYNTNEYKAFKTKYKRSPFDALAYHPYNTIMVNEDLVVDYNQVANAIKLGPVDIMSKNGDSKIPIWITEYGNQDPNEDINAVAVYNSIIEIAKIPQVETLHWFKYCYPAGNEKNYSIVYADGTRRKSFQSFVKASKQIQVK